MKSFLGPLFLAVAALFASVSFLPVPSHASDAIEPGTDSIKGEIVVELAEGASNAGVSSFASENGMSIQSNSPFSKSSRIMIVRTEGQVDEAVETLRKNPAVLNAEPNYVYKAFKAPNDPMFKYQWNMKKIDVEKAWMRSTGKGVIVAVIDTGVGYKNSGEFVKLEDFDKTSFVKPFNFVSDTEDAFDDNGHGSHVAGTVAQSTNNGKGVAGVAFNASIMPVKVLDANGSGRLSDIADGIKYAAANGAKVINMSLGGPYGSRILENACKYARSKGCLVVCAAGNAGDESPNFPAAYKWCVSVSSVRDDNMLAPYSSRGKTIDIAAPGGDMTVDQNKDGKPDGIMQNTIKEGDPSKQDYVLYQGTSMASPHVAGAAALVIAAGVKRPDQVEEVLKSTAFKKGLNLEEGYGAGILDAGAAVWKAYEMAASKGGSGVSGASSSAGTSCFGNVLFDIIALALALVFMALMRFTMSRLSHVNSFTSSLPFLLGVLAGSCGLFFIPDFIVSKSVLLQLAATGMHEWYRPLFGGSSFLSLLFSGAFIPVVAMFISLPFAFLRRLAAGLGTGMGAALAAPVLMGASALPAFGGNHGLEVAWLVVNAVVCLVCSYCFVKYAPEKKTF